MSKLWNGLIEFGTISAAILGISIILKLIKTVVDIVIQGTNYAILTDMESPYSEQYAVQSSIYYHTSKEETTPKIKQHNYKV
jgi:hypothetical protein